MATASLDTLFSRLAVQTNEACAFAYFDAAGRLLGFRHLPAFSLDRTEVSLRRVAFDALAVSATVVTMAHNHPSGDPTASAGDYAVTRRIARGLDTLGVRLAEHIILAGDRSFSLRAAGAL